MDDLVSAVPGHEPADDTLAYAGKAAASAIPIVGPLIAETLAYALDMRQAARQHEFNVLIAGTLTEAMSRLDEALTVEQVVDSDEFVAAVTRARRAAAETASQDKRRRLAAAVANGGSWAPFSASEREQFTRLVESFDDLHVFLLHYFTDPKAWLDNHELQDAYQNIYMGSAGTPLSAALGVPESEWRGPVAQAANDLDRNALAHIPLETMMSADGVITPRTNEKGRRFLTFLAEPASVSVSAPTVL